MKLKKRSLLILGLCIGILTASAQNLKKADYLFNNKSYVDAANLYLKENNKTKEIHQKLGDCYFFNTEMDSASKWYGELFKKFDEKEIDSIYYYRFSKSLEGIKQYGDALIWLQKFKKATENLDSKAVITSSYRKIIAQDTSKLYTIKNLAFNNGDSEFGGFIQDDKLVFASARTKGRVYNWDKQPYLDLYQANIDSLTYELSDIKPFSDDLNTDLHESNATFSNDGSIIYFTRNNYLKGKKKQDKNNITHLKIYRAQLTGTKWTDITELPFNSDDYSCAHPVLTDDGKTLYFSSDMPGSVGSFDLYKVAIKNDSIYGKPVSLGKKVNTIHREQFPFYSSDTLYFASDGHLGYGGLDIFKTYEENGEYVNPINLKTPVNSNLDDFGYVINDSLDFGYFSSNREEGKGYDDIYLFYKNNTIKLNGIVKDQETDNSIDEATVYLLNDKGEILESYNTSTNGKYEFNIKPDSNYTIKTIHRLYNTNKIPLITTQQGNSNSPIVKDIYLQLYEKIDKEIVTINSKTQIKHEPIYFELNSSYLTNEAKEILDGIVAIIKKYPDMKIQCDSHTDSRESHEYNQWLSDRRAKRTAAYIISKGVDASRITMQGHGETQLVNNCSDGVPCSETQHQLNRRTEFVLR